jgi:hypothetical protein
MADNCCTSSSSLEIPEGKREQAKTIVDRVVTDLESGEEGCCDCCVEVEESSVWFYSDEYINPAHVAEIARALVEELEIDEPFYCSWAYTCSKLRVDEFGGGAFGIVRGKPTIWVDAMSEVQRLVEAASEGDR